MDLDGNDVATMTAIATVMARIGCVDIFFFSLIHLLVRKIARERYRKVGKY